MQNCIRSVFLFHFLVFSQLVVSVLICTAQSSWEVVNQSNTEFFFNDAIVNSDTTYYVLGGYTGYSLLKYDKHGNKLWTKPTFGCCRNLIKGFDNYIYTFGIDTCLGNPDNQIFVAKYNLFGDTVWTKKLGPPGSVVNTAMGHFMNDTALLVAVSSTIYSPLQQLTLIKLDTSGSIIWGNDYPPYKFPYDIKEYDGSYKIAGGYGILTIDKEGNETDDERTDVELRSINIDQAGNYLGSNSDEIFKLDTSLNFTWIIDVSDSIDCFQSLLVNSHIYITGHFNDYSNDRKDQALLGKISASDGSVVWTRSYGGLRDESGYQLQQTLDGGFIIAAATQSWPKYEEHGYLIKTDSLGFTSNCADSLGFIPDTIVECVGVHAYVQNNSIGSYAEYTWYFNGDSIHSGMESLLISNDSIGVHTLSLVSCTDTLETLFRTIPWPKPEIGFAIYDDSVQFYNSSELHAYWDFGDGWWSIEKEPSHIYEESGDYVISLTLDNFHCWESVDTNLTILISHEKEFNENQIIFYPNPTRDFLSISVPVKEKHGQFTVVVYNQFGQKVLSAYQPLNMIDVSSLKSGIYFIEFVSSEYKLTEKLVIK